MKVVEYKLWHEIENDDVKNFRPTPKILSKTKTWMTTKGLKDDEYGLDSVGRIIYHEQQGQERMVRGDNGMSLIHALWHTSEWTAHCFGRSLGRGGSCAPTHHVGICL